MSKTISARIDETLHSMITDEANQTGKTVNESLKEMLNNHFNGEEEKNESYSQTAENSEMVMQLNDRQKKQNEKLEEIHKIFHKLIDLVTKNQFKTLQEVDQRIKNHESKFEHTKEFHGLRCKTS